MTDRMPDITGARNIAVYDALTAAGEPITAKQVWETMTEASIGSVHRSLAKLEGLGHVQRGDGKWTIIKTKTTRVRPVKAKATDDDDDTKETFTEVTSGSYLSRKIAGKPDIEALKAMREAQIYTLLYGPPGTGKTALAKAAFAGDIIAMACDENTTPDDFLGQWYPDGEGGWTFGYGPLSTAMNEGKVLFIDDITLAGPKALAVLYPAIDGQGKVTIKTHVVDGKPEVIEAKEGFYVIAAHNPGVHGAILTDALSSRFTFQVYVDTDLDLAKRLGVPDRFVKLAKNLYAKQGTGTIGWAPQLRELLAAKAIAEKLGEQVAVQNLMGVVPSEDREPTKDVISSIFGFAATPLAMQK
jgi:nitric oxide reductase NorQ protein